MGRVKPLFLVAGKAHVDPAVGQLVKLVRALGQVLPDDQGEDDQQGEEQGETTGHQPPSWYFSAVG
jgi:hypothetical protein